MKNIMEEPDDRVDLSDLNRVLGKLNVSTSEMALLAQEIEEYGVQRYLAGFDDGLHREGLLG